MNLEDSLLYLVAPARVRAGALVDLVAELASAGVDLVQLREKNMEVRELLSVARPLLEACRAAGIPFIVNDRPDVAVTIGADGVHVGQDDLPPEATRRIFPKGILGLSTHSIEEVEAALGSSPLLDYVAVGPVNETPTKPGRPATGIDLVRHAAARLTLPWFVTGGMAQETLEPVLDAGGRRIVVVRAITQAADPPEAARRLKQMLLSVNR